MRSSLDWEAIQLRSAGAEGSLLRFVFFDLSSRTGGYLRCPQMDEAVEADWLVCVANGPCGSLTIDSLELKALGDYGEVAFRIKGNWTDNEQSREPQEVVADLVLAELGARPGERRGREDFAAKPVRVSGQLSRPGSIVLLDGFGIESVTSSQGQATASGGLWIAGNFSAELSFALWGEPDGIFGMIWEANSSRLVESVEIDRVSADGIGSLEMNLRCSRKSWLVVGHALARAGTERGPLASGLYRFTLEDGRVGYGAAEFANGPKGAADSPA